MLRVLTNPPAQLLAIAACADVAEFRRDARDLLNTLGLLCAGAIRGMFDRPSSITADLDTPALSLDISALDDDEDDVVAAAMLSSWAWAAAVIDGSAAIGRRRNVLRVQDELWRALRVAPGLVERSDRVTRLGRHRGEVSVQVTHSLDDLEALPTEADRAKARGLAARNGIMVLGGMADQRTRRHRSDHPADRAGSGDGAVLGRPTDLGHRHPPPRPRQIPDQVRGAGRAAGGAVAGRDRTTALRHRPGLALPHPAPHRQARARRPPAGVR